MASDGRRAGRREFGLGILLALGLGALLLHLLGGVGASPDGRTAPEDALRTPGAGPAEALAGPVAPALSAPPPRPDSASADASADVAPAPAPVATSVPVFAGAAAVLRVALRLPDAWRATEGQVYALPAGATEGNDAPDRPHVGVPARASEVRLPLPRTGRWDVGYVGRFGHVLAPDVLAEGTVDVVLDARDAAPIRFRPRGGAGPTAPGRVTVRALDGFAMPGRGQGAPVSVALEIDGTEEILTPPLAVGVEYRVAAKSGPGLRAPGGAPGFEWTPSRERARAGDEVDLVLSPLGLVRVALELGAPLPQAWVKERNTDLWVAAGAQAETEVEPSHFASTYLRKDGTFHEDVLLLPLAPGRYTFRMHPEGLVFRDTSRAIEVRPGEVLDLRATAVLDPAMGRPGAAGTGTEFGTQVTLQVGAAPGSGWRLAAETWDGEALGWSESGGEQGGEIEVASAEPIRRALLVLPPDRASDVFEVPARGAHRVTLQPAGMLVLVPEVAPDPALGALRVRRADGLPLPVLTARDSGGEVEFDDQPDVRMGTVLGPLVEGRLSLEVRLGGVVIARPVAQVRAGKHTPLAIPIPAGLPR